MAPIRKAKGYITYLIALLITGMFGLFHKAPPAWAEEVVTDRNATVFSDHYGEKIRVAQNQGSYVRQLRSTGVQSKIKTAEWYPGAGKIAEWYPGAGKNLEWYPGAGKLAEWYPGPSKTAEWYPGAGKTVEWYPGAGKIAEWYPGAGKTVEWYPGAGKTEQIELSASSIGTQNEKFYKALNDRLGEVYAKIEKGEESLTVEEIGLIIGAQYARENEALRAEMNALKIKVMEFQEKMDSSK